MSTAVLFWSLLLFRSGSIEYSQLSGRPESSERLRPSQETGVMEAKAKKLLVVESDDALRERIVAVLSDAGLSGLDRLRGRNEGNSSFGPDVVILWC